MIDKFWDDLEKFLTKWNFDTMERDGWYLSAETPTVLFKCTLEMRPLRRKK